MTPHTPERRLLPAAARAAKRAARAKAGKPAPEDARWGRAPADARAAFSRARARAATEGHMWKSTARLVHAWEKQVLLARGFKWVGRHSEYAI